MNLYVFDTSAVIPANSTYYDPKFCPAFWQWMKDAVQNGRLEIIQPIADEIENQDPNLWQYLKQIDCQMSIPLDENCLAVVREVANHVSSDFHHDETAKQAFMRTNFPELMAYAKLRNATIVTLEQSDRTPKDVIKLPDICHDLAIPCINTFEMLRRENPRFVLENRSP